MSAISSNTEYWSNHTKVEVEDHIKARFVAVETPIVAQSSSSFTAVVNKYYVFANAVGTITITLPAVSNTGYVQSCCFRFTTSSSPSVTFSGNGKTVKYYADYAIEASTTYEINALYNGTDWVIAYAKIS